MQFLMILMTQVREAIENLDKKIKAEIDNTEADMKNDSRHVDHDIALIFEATLYRKYCSKSI